MTQIPVYKSKNSIIPGADFIANPFEFTIRQSRLLGNFYRVPFVFRKLFVASDIEAISHVLQKNQKNYVKSIAYRHLRLALGNGLVTSEGEYWRNQRRLVQPVFYKNRLEEMFQKMELVTRRYVSDLQQRTAGGQVLDLSREMMRITADITLMTLFSTDEAADLSEVYRIMLEAQDYIIFKTARPHLSPLVYLDGRHRRFKRDIRWFDAYIYRLIADRKSQERPPADLLTLLIQARDEDTGQPMTDREIRDEAITIYAAGHETSSTALCWTLYLLAQHAEVLRKVRQEIEEVTGGRQPGFEDLRQLAYTAQVIQESMRLYPPAFAIGRQPVKDDVILGHPVPAYSIVFLSIGALHRDPAHWERPDEFFPEHFSPEAEKQRPRMAYMPFGAGPRMCVGNHFAMMEMQLLLSLFVRHFDFELVGEHPVVPEPLITLKPKHGILMKIVPRSL
jgi:cytochrome P450